ncbi:protein kinase [Candidatus Woesearchaeota archaeon]|nr:protein kinase [Candidatus Woesearchaeota archaeon]
MRLNDTIKELILKSGIDEDVLKTAIREDRKMCIGLHQIVGDYEAGEICAQGGIGELRYAFNRQTGQHLVIKYPLPGLYLLMGDKLYEMFEQEAETLARLRHPNIVESYDAFEHKGVPHIPMECIYLGIDTFFGEKPTVERAYLFMRDAVRALKYSHDNGMVHCDVKPFNFRVAAKKDGIVSVKLADWGSARNIGDSTAGIVSTPAYYPLAVRPAQVSPEIDLYGFGKTALRIMMNSTNMPSAEISERMNTGENDDNMNALIEGLVPPSLVNFIIRPCLEAPKGNGFTTRDLEREIDGFGMLFGFKYERISRDLYTGVVTATERRHVIQEEIEE